jgi:phosphoribosylanthranilate isomerase
MIRIKICGITNWEDARLAVELGADALGFIFTESPRRVTPEQAAAITGQLTPPVCKIGVFLDHQEEEVKAIAECCRLDGLQLHGQETPAYCKRFRQKVIKAFRIRDATDLKALSLYEVDAFLLDTYHESLAGGTGKTFDWNLAVEAKKHGKIILSGGLNPDNVFSAITKVKPYAVDVSSGVEASPGKKDPVKLKAFIEEVRRAEGAAG